MQEEWKDVEGFEGYYQVSNFGRARSLDREITYKDGRSRCWLKGRLMTLSLRKSKHHNVIYTCFGMSKHDKRVTGHTHILVAKAFIPNPRNLPQVNHIDGDGINNKIGNLEWVTSRQNQLHAYRTGLRKAQRGELHGKSKLTDDQVCEIIALKGKMFQKEIALYYNVCRQTINRIWTGNGWTHLQLTNINTVNISSRSSTRRRLALRS